MSGAAWLRASAAAAVAATAAAAAGTFLSGPRGEAGPANAASCADLSPGARRGKLLFRRGVTAAGAPVTALLGDGPASLEGRNAACAGCHLYSGAGGDEGDLAAPPITPEHLFREANRRRDRVRPAYDAASLAVAIREGRTPSGRRLGMGMPRFDLSQADVEDLVAYLRCVGLDSDPGVSGDRVRVGAALPLTGPLADLGADARAVLEASFAEVNAGGGIFGRSIELVVEDSGREGGEAGAAARLAAADVLALAGSLWADARAPTGAGGDDEIPLVAPVGPLGDASAADFEGEQGFVFYLHSGPRGLARAAVKALAAAHPPGTARLLVAHARGRAGEAWLAGAREEASRRGLAAPDVLPFDAGDLDDAALTEAARAGGAGAILLWGSAGDLARGAAALSALPAVVLHAPGHLLGEARSAVPARVRGQVSFLAPGVGTGAAGEGTADLRSLLQRHNIPPRHLAVQARARASALVLIEALKRSGARPTRDGLVAALETLHDFETGLTPPLSFGRGRRVGAIGAALVQIGAESGVVERAPVWIGLAP